MKQAASSSRSSPTEIDQSVAIIGMACRFPGAFTPNKLWKILRDGQETVKFFSSRQLLQAGHDPGLVNRPDYVRAYGMLGNIGEFDADFFDFTPQEAEITDPQHRLFLECAWEALEQAGYVPEQYPGVIGVFAGAGGGDTYYLNHLHPHRDLRESLGVQRLQLANDKDFLAARVAYHLNLTGPALTVQAAGATSLAAVIMGYQSLLDYQADLILAGGVNICVPEITGYRYHKNKPYSPDGHCRAFDASSQGYAPGNGAGVVVLKRLSEAVRDGDYIHAVVRGAALTHDGGYKPEFTMPSVDGQARAVSEALALAELEPEDITYLEAYGSGQPLADAIEIAALTKAFRGTSDAVQFCALGSVKTNLGHLRAAAGIAGLIKTVLAIHHRQIPPSLYFQTPNPRTELENSPFYVNTHLQNWEKPRRAGINAYGLGGTNAHLIVEEAPLRNPATCTRQYHLLVLSARSPKALSTMRTRFARFLENNTELPLADIMYTLQRGRKAFPYRFHLVGQEFQDFIIGLRLPELQTMRILSNVPSVIFYFPANGVCLGMGHTLYRDEKFFRAQIDRCAQWILTHAQWDLRHVLFPHDKTQRETSAQKLDDPIVKQVALFSLEYALARLWMHWGVQPQAMAGNGMGEIVITCLNHGYSLEESLSLLLSAPHELATPENTFSSSAHAVMIAYPQAIILEIGPPHTSQQLPAQIGQGRVIVSSLSSAENTASDAAAMLNALGQLWTYGVSAEWANLYAGERRQRLPLPTYPFERHTYWIDPPKYVYHG